MKQMCKLLLRLAMCVSLFLIFGEPAEDSTLAQVIMVKAIAIGIIFLDYKINYQYAERSTESA